MCTAPLLERKLTEKLIQGGYVPEWLQLKDEIDAANLNLKTQIRDEISKVLRVKSMQIDLRYCGEMMASSAAVANSVSQIANLTKKFNALCPPALQRTSHSSHWISALIDTEISARLEAEERESAKKD